MLEKISAFFRTPMLIKGIPEPITVDYAYFLWFLIMMSIFPMSLVNYLDWRKKNYPTEETETWKTILFDGIVILIYLFLCHFPAAYYFGTGRVSF